MNDQHTALQGWYYYIKLSPEMALMDKFTTTFALLPIISVWYDCKNKFKYRSYFFDSFVTCQFFDDPL